MLDVGHQVSEKLNLPRSQLLSSVIKYDFFYTHTLTLAIKFVSI